MENTIRREVLESILRNIRMAETEVHLIACELAAEKFAEKYNLGRA